MESPIMFTLWGSTAKRAVLPEGYKFSENSLYIKTRLKFSSNEIAS